MKNHNRHFNAIVLVSAWFNLDTTHHSLSLRHA